MGNLPLLLRELLSNGLFGNHTKSKSTRRIGSAVIVGLVVINVLGLLSIYIRWGSAKRRSCITPSSWDKERGLMSRSRLLPNIAWRDAEDTIEE